MAALVQFSLLRIARLEMTSLSLFLTHTTLAVIMSCVSSVQLVQKSVEADFRRGASSR